MDMDNNKIQNFIEYLDKYNTNLNVFIKLYNMWTALSFSERGEIINKKLGKNL